MKDGQYSYKLILIYFNIALILQFRFILIKDKVDMSFQSEGMWT